MDVPNIATDVGQLAHLQAVHTAACMHGLVLYICSHYDGAGLGFGIEHTVAYFYLLLFYCAVSTERSVLLRAHKCVLMCACVGGCVCGALCHAHPPGVYRTAVYESSQSKAVRPSTVVCT
jgi:hypothetical protein